MASPFTEIEVDDRVVKVTNPDRVYFPPTDAAPSGATKLDLVIGHVTSGAPSPTLGYPIALAYVTPEVSAVGTRLAVDVRGRGETVEVVELPFYRRPRS